MHRRLLVMMVLSLALVSVACTQEVLLEISSIVPRVDAPEPTWRYHKTIRSIDKDQQETGVIVIWRADDIHHVCQPRQGKPFWLERARYIGLSGEPPAYYESFKCVWMRE